MKVKMLKTIASPGLTAAVGQVRELDSSTAKALIKEGAAERVVDKSTRVNVKAGGTTAETASTEPPETRGGDGATGGDEGGQANQGGEEGQAGKPEGSESGDAPEKADTNEQPTDDQLAGSSGSNKPKASATPADKGRR